jgi:TPR repeat protein
MMRMSRLRWSGLAWLLLLPAFAPGAFAQSTDFRQGLSAFNRAEYAAAFDRWEPEARAGGADAQSGLGFLYYRGFGVPQNYARAFDWYARAARQGQPEAQMFLGALYLYGDGVERDLVKAYAWCEISQSNGALGGLDCRQQAQRHMTEAQIASAIALVADYYRNGPKPETQ